MKVSLDSVESKEKPSPIYSWLTSNGKSLHEHFNEPCPSSTGFIKKDDQALHNWVFNHLPINDQQKQQLLVQLQRDELLAIRTRERQKQTEKQKKVPQKTVINSKKTKPKSKWRSSATTNRNSSHMALRRLRRN